MEEKSKEYNDIMHQFHIVSENIIDQVKLVAEGVAVVNEKLDRKVEYLEKKILDNKTMMEMYYRNLDKKIEATAERLDKKIEATAERLDKEIEATAGKLDKKIEATAGKLDKKIEAMAERLDKKIEATKNELKQDIRRIEGRIIDIDEKVEKHEASYHRH